MEIQDIDIEGHKLKGAKIPTGNTVILIIEAPIGFLGCGYFDLEIADRVKDVAAVVTGVKTFDDLLNKPVQKVSQAAKERGISVGCSGLEALRKMLG
ncbi:MAG: DUF1805 domain-containing protein [bacterium]|nr:DUF1805 domain-containing protein [bacterium]